MARAIRARARGSETEPSGAAAGSSDGSGSARCTCWAFPAQSHANRRATAGRGFPRSRQGTGIGRAAASRRPTGTRATCADHPTVPSTIGPVKRVRIEDGHAGRAVSCATSTRADREVATACVIRMRSSTWSKGGRCPDVCDRRFRGGSMPGARHQESPATCSRSSCSRGLADTAASSRRSGG
jgi:hypothetical protein